MGFFIFLGGSFVKFEKIFRSTSKYFLSRFPIGWLARLVIENWPHDHAWLINQLTLRITFLNFSQNAMKIKKINYQSYRNDQIWNKIRQLLTVSVKWTIIGSMIHHVCPVIVLMEFIHENGQIIISWVYKDANKNL